jgi:hypothetical protein
MAAGLLNYDQPDPLTLGLLGFSQAISAPRSRGGGVAAALSAFPAGQMQAAEMRRRMEADELRKQLAQAQIGEYEMKVAEAKRAREMQQQLQDAARRAYTAPSAGSLGGGVAPGSQQGQMLLGQMSGDPEFDSAMLQSTNSALNSVGPQQGISAPTAGGFDPQDFVRRLEAAGMPLEAARYRKELMGEREKPMVVDGNLVTPDGRVLFTAPEKAQSVSPGGALVRNGQVVFQAPDRPPAPSDLGKLTAEMNALPPGDPRRAFYVDAIRKLITHAPPASMNVSYGAPFSGVGPDGKEMLYQPTNRGGPPMPTGLAPPPKDPKDPTEGQSSSAGYVARMLTAESAYAKIGKDGRPSLGRELAANLPLTGGMAGPYVRTENQQLARSAQEEWVRAKLRKESGAAIPPDEMDREIETYFPKPGEPDSVVKQKAQFRRQAQASMSSAAGRAPIPTLNEGDGRQFKALPPAQNYKGKTIRNDQTGELMRSNGMSWDKVK